MRACNKCHIVKPESDYNKRWPKVCRACQAAVMRAWYHKNPGRKKLYRPLGSTYNSMISRCTDPKDKKYQYYGARGITICERWVGKDGYHNFVADMGLKPSPKHSLDRINNDGNYEPSNCRWATHSQQQLNKRLFKNNTSGFKGVTFDKKSNKWKATISHDGKRKYLGCYQSPLEAAIAWNHAASKYRGADAWLNPIN